MVHEHVTRLGAGADHGVVTVLDEPLVVEDRALGESCRARGVLDLDRIVGLGGAEPADVLAREQRVVVGEQDPMPDRREVVAHGVHDLAHRVPAELSDVVDGL